MPLSKGEYITPKAMGRYEEGQRAVMVAAQQLGVGTDFFTTSGADAAASLAKTPIAPQAAGISGTVTARSLPGEDDMSPGWTATDATPQRRSTQHARLAAGAGRSLGGRSEDGGGAGAGRSLGGGSKDGGGGGALRGAATGGSEGAFAAEVGTTAAEPKLSIYDDWEGDDDDFGGVI